jgi:hypothetical protein
VDKVIVEEVIPEGWEEMVPRMGLAVAVAVPLLSAVQALVERAPLI